MLVISALVSLLGTSLVLQDFPHFFIQVEFYQQIQRSMQSADRKPPKLVQGPESIHPAGTALVTTTDDESVNTADTKKTNSTVSHIFQKRCHFWGVKFNINGKGIKRVRTCVHLSVHFMPLCCH